MYRYVTIRPKGLSQKICRKAKRATSSDVFNIIQKRPNTVVHLFIFVEISERLHILAFSEINDKLLPGRWLCREEKNEA